MTVMARESDYLCCGKTNKTN